MSQAAQYADTPRHDFATVTTAETSYTAPTTFVTSFVAGPSGSRIDQIDFQSVGTSVAGLLRLFIVKGIAGATISSITFSSTTATVTTATSHGLSTGAFITVGRAFPVEYNVKDAAITVTGLTTYTYPMSAAPTINASTVGSYSYRLATAVQTLWKEFPIQGVMASSTVPAIASSISSQLNSESLPLILPAGYALRATVTTTQTGTGISVIARGGDF